MMFYGIKDFYLKKIIIKTKYLFMNEKEKRNYKRFVYSISFENEYVKDVIWEYLNDEENSNEVLDKLYFSRIERNKK